MVTVVGDAKEADASERLQAYRAARVKARAELRQLGNALRELITVGQESRLVGLGVLD